MTLKKKTKKKTAKVVKPLHSGDIVTFPCGGTVVIESLTGLTTTLRIASVLLSGTSYGGGTVALRDVRLILTKETVAALPTLVRRAIESFKRNG